MQLAIAIRITDFKESPKRAIKSILANKEHNIKEIYIIHPNYDGGATSLYDDGWKEDSEALKNANISVYFKATLDVKHINSESSIVVEVPPNCELRLGAFDTIKQYMSKANNNQTHFALTPTMQFTSNSVFYGFIIVMQTIDWLWNRIFERNKLIQSTDVQVRFLMKKGKRQYLPEPTFVWRIWNSATIPKVHTSSAILYFNDGWNDVMWLLNMHSHLKVGLWLIPYALFYIVLTFSWSMMVVYQTMLVYASIMWILEVVVSYFTCKNYIHTKTGIFHYCLLFPIYWIMFPFVLIHAKWR